MEPEGGEASSLSGVHKHMIQTCGFLELLANPCNTPRDLKALSTMIQGKLTAASKICNTCCQTSLTECPPGKAETL